MEAVQDPLELIVQEKLFLRHIENLDWENVPDIVFTNESGEAFPGKALQLNVIQDLKDWDTIIVSSKEGGSRRFSTDEFSVVKTADSFLVTQNEQVRWGV